MQSAIPLLSIFLLAGSGIQLSVSRRLSENPGDSAPYCRLNLCDDDLLTKRAYDLQLKATPDSVDSAIRLLSDLLIRDPAQPQRWADLGSALQDFGSVEKARYCMDRALKLGPYSADILLTAGDFYLIFGDRSNGLRILAQLLTIANSRDAQVFSYYAAREVPIADVLNHGLPPGKRAAHSYLRYLMQQPELAAAQEVWRSLTARKLADPEITAEYSTFLTGQGQFEEAAEAWASEMTPPPSGYHRTEYVYNGGFETEPAHSPFDWSLTPADHVDVSRERNPRSGDWALRLRFDGEANVDFNTIVQKAVLRPGAYRFQASVRTDGLTTDQGLWFRITDPQKPDRLTFEVEAPHEAADWRTISGVFVSPQPPRLVEIRIVRRPSWKFDSKIKGTVWIDDVSLIRTGQ